MNSILGSVVPLAMFLLICHNPREDVRVLKIDPQVMALVEFCYKASSESKKAKVMVVLWKLSWIAGKLWWSCGYYGGSVENMVDCCNWQYLAQFCWWRYFCWVGVKIIFSPCPHLHFWLLIVYFHCIGIQRLYIRLWWYGEIISLNPTTTGVEPSERSWRSKEHIFISMRTLIHRVFSRKSGYYTRLQKSGICIFILCALSATRNCVFSCQKKKKNWDD